MKSNYLTFLSSSGFRCNHSGLPSICKYPSSLNDRSGITNWFQLVLLAGCVVNKDGISKVHSDNIPSLALLPGSGVMELQRVHLSRGHGVAEEDARVALRHDGAGAGGPERDGRVLAGGAAPEVGPADDDGVAGGLLTRGDEGRRVGRGGEPREGEGAELAVLVGLGRHQGEVLRGDDLVGVDVVAHHEDLAVENRGRRGAAARRRGRGNGGQWPSAAAFQGGVAVGGELGASEERAGRRWSGGKHRR